MNLLNQSPSRVIESPVELSAKEKDIQSVLSHLFGPLVDQSAHYESILDAQ